MSRKLPIKLINTEIRLVCELVTAFIVLIISTNMATKFVLIVVFSLLVGILIMCRNIHHFSPWQLLQLRRPNPRMAFAESLVYTIGSFGLLIYLVDSQHVPLHFALGFLGIISIWVTIHIIYSKEYALRYYYDGKGLVFPDCPRPNWTEFLYQSFCIGTCYQTSDTMINTTAMRKLIATHGIFSYTMSVSIIAMMFGLISNIL